jgi:hypothetical protein
MTKKQATKRTTRDLRAKSDKAVKGGFFGSLIKPMEGLKAP